MAVQANHSLTSLVRHSGIRTRITVSLGQMEEEKAWTIIEGGLHSFWFCVPLFEMLFWNSVSSNLA